MTNQSSLGALKRLWLGLGNIITLLSCMLWLQNAILNGKKGLALELCNVPHPSPPRGQAAWCNAVSFSSALTSVFACSCSSIWDVKWNNLEASWSFGAIVIIMKAIFGTFVIRGFWQEFLQYNSHFGYGYRRYFLEAILILHCFSICLLSSCISSTGPCCSHLEATK